MGIIKKKYKHFLPFAPRLIKNCIKYKLKGYEPPKFPYMWELEKGNKVYRWDWENYGRSRLSTENYGKEITDNNPYYDIDVDDFDLYSETYPPGLMAAPLWTEDMHYIADVFYPTLTRATRKAIPYTTILKDLNRMNTEWPRGNKKSKVAGDRERDLSKLACEIKEYGKSVGAAAIGITKVDRRSIADESDELVPYDTLIMIAHEMDYEQTMELPDPGHKTREHGIFKAYENAGRRAHLIADFIRNKGYEAIAYVGLDGVIKYPPHAANAGLGSFGSHAVLVTPQAGMKTRFSAVAINADLPLDRPKDYNIEQFCGYCRMCHKVCPSKAVPWESTMWKGIRRRKINQKRCLPMFEKHEDCGICQKNCPFSVFGYEKIQKNIVPSYYQYNQMNLED